ncbi:MAG: hypothetical protein JWR02_1950 [Mucilaginibacter sp.]|nr:hypothetical protein [Mucilaginibacter sp.]
MKVTDILDESQDFKKQDVKKQDIRNQVREESTGR